MTNPARDQLILKVVMTLVVVMRMNGFISPLAAEE